ncbi:MULTISPECIES: hypothetical protein [Bacillaceae]|uniref:Uncharacterized protein n=1 Tax=Evansella alkalicola TaxID=745819 RepID=A0ABS6JPW8_9BACI|nr:MULTISPECIES: hypothetical protein [Bacillaceae]MBU9720151.1 hypothetical protein [Bacillus alkalicola]
MKNSTLFKWITGGLEAFWGIPLIGGTLILSLAWTPLFFMLILHIVTLILSIRDNRKYHGSIMGIITSCLAWIPILGMILHIITGVLLLVDAYQTQKNDANVVEEI